jgi:hypothetical protein
MRALLIGIVVMAALVFVYLYLEAKARVYRGKMEAFASDERSVVAPNASGQHEPAAGDAVASADAESVPAKEAAAPGADAAIAPRDPAVDDDGVDAGGEAMRLRERRLV